MAKDHLDIIMTSKMEYYEPLHGSAGHLVLPKVIFGKLIWSWENQIKKNIYISFKGEQSK